VHWKNDELVLEPDGGDQPDTEFYGLSPFAYGNQYLGFLWMLHTYSQQLDVQLVSSRDGHTWNRSVHRRVFLPLGFMKNGYTGHAFDSDMIMSVAPPALMDGRLYIYYSGHSAKHNANAIETEPNYQENSSQVDDTYFGSVASRRICFSGCDLRRKGRDSPSAASGVGNACHGIRGARRYSGEAGQSNMV
jgi:hypothetical protein